MSDSVRMSALSSSMTRIGSRLAGAESIEHSGDVFHGEGLLEVRPDPLAGKLDGNVLLRVRLAAVQNERRAGIGVVHCSNRFADIVVPEMQMQQDGPGAPLGHQMLRLVDTARGHRL